MHKGLYCPRGTNGGQRRAVRTRHAPHDAGSGGATARGAATITTERAGASHGSPRDAEHLSALRAEVQRLRHEQPRRDHGSQEATCYCSGSIGASQAPYPSFPTYPPFPPYPPFPQFPPFPPYPPFPQFPPFPPYPPSAACCAPEPCGCSKCRPLAAPPKPEPAASPSQPPRSSSSSSWYPQNVRR